MSDYRVTGHAAHRYAERIAGAENPRSPRSIAEATQAILALAERAKTTYRYRDKSRAMADENGVHLIVKKGGWIATVLAPGQPAPRCRCMHCITARAHRAKMKREGR